MSDQKGAFVRPTDSIGDPDNFNINADGLPIGTDAEDSTADIVPLLVGSEILRLRESKHTTFMMDDSEGASNQPVDINKGSFDQPTDIKDLRLDYRRAEYVYQEEASKATDKAKQEDAGGHCQECGNHLCSKCRETCSRTRLTKGITVSDFGAIAFLRPRENDVEGSEETGASKGGLVRENEEHSGGETREGPGLTMALKSQGCLTSNADTEVPGQDAGRMLRRFIRVAEETLAASNDLGKVTRLLALCICEMVCTCKRADHCGLDSWGHRALEPVSNAEFQLSRSLQFLCSAPDSITAINSKELRSLGACLKQGEVWRYVKGYSAVLATAMGITALSVIMLTTRLAYLLMTQALD